METKTQHESGITRRKSTQYTKFCPKEERNASLKKVSSILQKAEHERTLDEQQILGQYSEVVTALKLRWQRRDEAKRRLEEVEEPINVLEEKCEILARAIVNSEHLVIYTGAGISTAARIPDYRGSNGIWTRLQQGKEIGSHDLSLAEPTFTHMALAQLYRNNILKYVVSQNCDGLHLRSGLPRSALSELHGNMYIEVCKNCKPAREYWRLFDVTENTARYSHKTMRRCYICSHELIDTIVHFGERGTLQWPLNWSGACKNADAADTILCLGSSLKVLKRYPWLWQMSKPAKKRPNLYIVNLQWTPKDDCAVMKINGKCDTVMKMIMKYLCVDVPNYERDKDPIFAHATFLCELETHTTSQPSLKQNDCEVKKELNNDSHISMEPVCELKVELVDKYEQTNNETPQNAEVKEKFDFDNDSKENDSESLRSSITTIPEQKYPYDLTINKRYDSESNIKDKSISAKINNIGNTNCDNISYTSIKTSRLSHVYGPSSTNCTLSEQNNATLPKRKSHFAQPLTTDIHTPLTKHNSNIFSIDSILKKTDKVISETITTAIPNQFVSNNVLGPNMHTIMAYYEFANTVLQNQMLGYFSAGVYPYQTSFLYPGLHSIINPIPYFTYDFECPNITNTIANTFTDCKQISPKHENNINTEDLKSRAHCLFCVEIFNSGSCLYYVKTESVFVKQLHRFSKTKNCNKLLVCVCCDYSTDEECDSDENKSYSKVKKKPKRISKGESELDKNIQDIVAENECVSDNIDENICEDKNEKVEGKVKIQAGWFGKGYRKNRRPKKKQ